MADIIAFPERNRGNGAREALERVFDTEADLFPPLPEGESYHLKLPDRILLGLWAEGFKVVPLDCDD